MILQVSISSHHVALENAIAAQTVLGLIAGWAPPASFLPRSQVALGNAIMAQTALGRFRRHTLWRTAPAVKSLVAQAFQPALLIRWAPPTIFLPPLPSGERVGVRGVTWPSGCNQPKRRHPHPNPRRGRGLYFSLVPKLYLGTSFVLPSCAWPAVGRGSAPASLMVGHAHPTLLLP